MSLTRLLPVGHLPGTAALSKTLLLFSISPPLISPTNLPAWTSPDIQRCLRNTQSTLLTGWSCRSRNQEGAAGTMSSPLPGGQHPVPRAPSPPARPPRWHWRGCSAGASVLHSQRGLMSHRVPLAGGVWLFWHCPTELGGCQGRHGAGEGFGQGCGMGVTLSLQSQRGRGPGPEEIACQGLRRAAAARSPLAFRRTAAARRRKPPS